MEREQLTKFKNIADKILEELGYGNSKEIILDRKEASVWGYINQNTENSLYYIVSTCKEQDFYNIDFEELQAEIFKGIKGLFAQETGIEKNTTWLIGVECEKDYENLMEKILAIEENPYYFKKMVCPYLQIEINEFLKEIGSCQNYISYMQKQIVKVNRFVDFHEKNDMGYNFISKLLIATVYKGNIIKNLIMDCQSYTKYRPNETTGGIFVSWRRKEELPTGA